MHDENSYSGRFDGKTHLFAVRVYFEDTDAGGVVYHANYLRFMERARSDMLRVSGIDQRDALDGGRGVYVVSDLTIKYALSAKLDDELVVISSLQKVTGARCVIHQRVMRGGDIVTDAMVTAVFIGPDGRPKRQPPAWVAIFERVKGIE
jgi:acyl-CoA thioester hydrolase